MKQPLQECLYKNHPYITPIVLCYQSNTRRTSLCQLHRVQASETFLLVPTRAHYLEPTHWQHAPSEQWHGGNFHNYQGQDYEATSSGHQGGRMSFSGRGYHDFRETQYSINTRLTSIVETTAAIQDTLHQHSQWQATMGNKTVSLQ